MILVTGAGGFIGRHVVAGLTRTMPGSVRAFDLHFGDDLGEAFADAETVVGNLADAAVLSSATDGVHTVVHLASKHVDHDGAGFEQVNIEGTRAICRAATAAGVARVIYLSSVGVYGHGAHRDADEATPLAPDTPFSRSKAAAEKIVLDYAAAGEFEAVVLRHRFVYGDGDRAVLPRLIKAARSYPFWLSGGRARMSMIWAVDLAEVIRRLSGAEGVAIDASDPIYHVTDGDPLSYRRVITAICRAFDYRPPRFSVPYRLLYAPVRLRELLLGIDPEVAASSVTSIRLKLVAQDNDFSNRRLARLLPDLRFTPFEQAFEQSLDFYAEYR